jgi:hypothetical protein
MILLSMILKPKTLIPEKTDSIWYFQSNKFCHFF